jgi:hypothetical protein
MFGLRVFQVSLGLLLFGVIVTQMVIPQIRGTPWFPIRNLLKRKAEANLSDARDRLDTETIRAQTSRVNQQIEALRNKLKRRGIRK